MIDEKKKIKYNFIEPLILMVLVLLPAKSMFEYLKLAVVLVLAFFCVVKDQGVVNYKKGNAFIIWVLNIILAVIVAFVIDQTINTGRVFHEVARVAFYILVVYCCKHYRVKRSTISLICKILLLINLFIQLVQYFEIFETYEFLQNNYLDDPTKTIHLDLAYSGKSNFRSGSIYINPNVYMLFPIVFMIVFLYDSNETKSIMPYVWIVASAMSIFLTGSRTGLILFVVIFLIYIIVNKENKAKNIIVLIVGIVAIYLIFSLLGGSFDSRMFNINSEDSFGIKFQGLVGYFKISNPAYWIFGSLSSNVSVHIDMEFGYIVSWFGIIGLYWYFSLIKSIGSNIKPGTKFYYRAIQALIVVNMISSTAILSMNFFPFLCLVVFPSIVGRKEVKMLRGENL